MKRLLSVLVASMFLASAAYAQTPKTEEKKTDAKAEKKADAKTSDKKTEAK